MCQDFLSILKEMHRRSDLVSKLHYLVDEHGMNLTYALLGTIVKYPVSSLKNR